MPREKIKKEVPSFTVKGPALNKPEKKCSACGDAESMHYGTPDRWCNTSDCKCYALVIQND